MSYGTTMYAKMLVGGRLNLLSTTHAHRAVLENLRKCELEEGLGWE